MKKLVEKHNYNETDLANISALVEATDEERHNLWMNWADSARETKTSTSERFKRVAWDGRGGTGYWESIYPKVPKRLPKVVRKLFETRPTCFTLWFKVIENRLVCFWDPTSELVDYKVIRAYFDKYANKDAVRTNSTNFHNAIQHIKNLNEREEAHANKVVTHV